MSNTKIINIVNTDEQVVTELSKIIEKSSHDAIRARNLFILAVSGGSVVNMLVKGLPRIETDWSCWRIIFCDERIVPVDDKESTFGLYKTSLVPATPLKEDQFIPLDFTLAANPSANASKAAEDYEKRLKNIFTGTSLHTLADGKSYPIIDCAVLGVGPDGHTCSLFPGDSKSLGATAWVAAITNSPKPPPCRVTLTLPVFNYARTVVFPIAGSSKASIIKSILDDENTDLPACLIKSSLGKVVWLLDKQASSQLSEK